MQELESYLNKSYEDIVQFQKQKLNYIKETYDWLKDGGHENVESFSREYIELREKVDKLLKKTTSGLALVDSKRLLEESTQILQKDFLKGWQKRVKGCLLGEEVNKRIKREVDKVQQMHIVAEDIHSLRVYNRNSFHTFNLNKVATIKQTHNLYNLIHYDHQLISLSADQHLKVFDFVTRVYYIYIYIYMNIYEYKYIYIHIYIYI